MNRHVMSLIIRAAIILTALSSAVSAGTIEAQVLQYKLDHFYFNVGKESLVFPGHHFAIVRGKDTVVSGVIDESYDGVSIGSGTLPKDGKRNFEKYKAVVQTAETERLSVFRIGVPEEYYHEFANGTSLGAGNYDQFDQTKWVDRYLAGDDTILIIESEDTLALLDRLDKHTIDAVLFPGASRTRSNYQVYSVKAPFFAALLAYPLSGLNSDGQLSTSLFYRFDPAKLQTALTRECSAVGSFIDLDTTLPRPFPIDPIKGKELFRQITPRPSRVRICTNESLRPVALYFGDLLAREQCLSDIVLDTPKQTMDLILTYLYPNDAIWSANMLFALLFHDKPETRHSELPPVLNRLNDLRMAIDSTADLVSDDSAAYFQSQKELVDQGNHMLIHEYGCFPLFRPMLTLVTRRDVMGIKLDENGKLVFSGVKRILAPELGVKEYQ